MELISKEMYETRFPNNTNVNINDMENEARGFYLSLYSIYMDYFYQYLLKYTKLKKFDEKLKKYGLIKVEKENRDFYQTFAGDYLDYFYIRNNLYLERLTDEQTGLLGYKMRNHTYKLDWESEPIINSTYKKVTFEKIDEEKDMKEPIDINFGPDSLKFYVPNNSLVIGVRIKNTIKNPEDDTEVDRYLKNVELIEDMIQEIEESIMSSLPVEAYVIQYDDDSIRKLK